jgi:hypothetical protein
MKKFGDIRHNVNVSQEYASLAKEDEMVANYLKNNKQYRHAIYFNIQAMEKYIRSKIFTKVNPNLEYFRNRNRNHSLNDAIEFLLEILGTNEMIKKQIKNQMDNIFGDINFQFLHNNLRYPFYSEKHNDYSMIDFSLADCQFIENKNNILKKYLSELDRL